MRRRWHCSRCGKTGTARLETRVVFHRCRPPSRAVVWSPRFSAEEMTYEERLAWARIQLGGEGQ